MTTKPTTQNTLSVVTDSVEQVKEPMVEQIVEPGIDSAVGPAVEEGVDVVVEPDVESVVEPGIESVVESEVELKPDIKDELAETPTATEFDLESPELYLNRELTWLEFNRRVLNEAQDQNTPLFERFKFVGIVSSNLDEFFMKRIGGLKQQVGAGVTELTVDGRSPAQQIDESYRLVREIEAQKDALLPQLTELLVENDIHLTAFEVLDDTDREAVRNYYLENIYPLVTP